MEILRSLVGLVVGAYVVVTEYLAQPIGWPPSRGTVVFVGIFVGLAVWLVLWRLAHELEEIQRAQEELDQTVDDKLTEILDRMERLEQKGEPRR